MPSDDTMMLLDHAIVPAVRLMGPVKECSDLRQAARAGGAASMSKPTGCDTATQRTMQPLPRLYHPHRPLHPLAGVTH